MSDYTDVAELAADQNFQEWCINATPDQSIDWNAWASEQPNRPELVAAAKKIVFALNLRPDAQATQVAYRSVRRKVNHRRSSRRTYRLAYAATLALLISALGVWWVFTETAAPEYATVQTANGELVPITLPDGTVVTLNANSSLRYAENFLATDVREAWLKGEGYFDVTPATAVGERPFTLHTNAGDVMVVGTEFNVRQREDIFEVVLTEGQVRVEDAFNHEVISLVPGERAIARDGKAIRIEAVETEAFVAWQQRQLLFRDMPLSRVVERLQYDYQLNLHIPDKQLLQKRISASIKDGDPFALTLALASIYQLDMDINTDSTTITLTPH